MQQILADSKWEKFAYNQDKYIRVNLESTQGLLPVSDMSSSVDEYQQYFTEFDASNKYRLIFTINPVCSNVLFNNITEIVYNEGGDDCIFFGVQGPSAPYNIVNGRGGKQHCEIGGMDRLNTYNEKFSKNGLDRYSLIQDTSYSHKEIGPFVYHCGSDIFNNHTLRAKEFTVVNKMIDGNREFNTLSDYLRDHDGKIVKDYKGEISGSTYSNKEYNRHLYTMNTIKPFSTAIDDNLIEENGWFGFKNPTSLNVENYTEAVTINKCMNNNKAGEFIDMYPDRSLYSFIPKYNKLRDRQEYNWEYCLTYPYTSETNNPLIQVGNYNGIECVATTQWLDISEIGKTESSKLVQFKTYIRHGLTTSNKVRIAIFSGDTFISETAGSIPVAEIGNGGYDGVHYFSVRLNDILPLLYDADGNYQPNRLETCKFRVVKYVNGARCKYYFRKFRKLPNFNGTNVYQNNTITEEDIISGQTRGFNTSYNKVAFAENIYSDKLAEIVVNDNVDTTGLKDNLGRDLSEIYLTIVKTNYGHEKWYNGQNYTDETIEFSHCFGKITSGLDMENGKKDYNVHTLHNIELPITGRSADYIPESGQALEDDITINSSDFLGDLVELSPYTLEETTLENVYHRFNTAQREIVSEEYADIYYDDIMFDDFDIPQTGETGLTGFTVEKRPYCVTADTRETTADTLENAYYANLAPEGYYYQPHYKIQIKSFVGETQWGSNQKVIYTLLTSNTEDNIYYIHTSKNYYFNIKDEIILYNKETLKRISGQIVNVEGKYYTEITLTAQLEEGKRLNDYMIFKINPIRPSNAYDLDDGTGRYVWRAFIPASAMTREDSLYDMPFVNGAHYIHKNINFYLRRQDPYGLYGLSFGLDGEGTPIPLLNLIVTGNEKDVDKFDYLENAAKTC